LSSKLTEPTDLGESYLAYRAAAFSYAIIALFSSLSII